MHRFSFVALISLHSGLALACGDDDGSDTGQGGTQTASNGGTQNGSNAGAAGSTSMSGGAGGSSSGASGAGGASSSGVSDMAGNSFSDPVVQDVCARGCAKTEPLNCANDPADCEAQCLADYLSYPEECRELVLAWGNCGAARPASDLLCNDTGRAALRDGICEAEALAVVSCVLGGF